MMRITLNSMTWFFIGTSIGIVGGCVFFGVSGRGMDAIGILLFGPILLVVGTLVFFVVATLASGITGETHRYWLSLTTGLLYPVSLGGLMAWFDAHVSMQLPLAVTIICVFLASVACECVLFGAGWLVLYGPKYYRDYLAP